MDLANTIKQKNEIKVCSLPLMDLIYIGLIVALKSIRLSGIYIIHNLYMIMYNNISKCL